MGGNTLAPNYQAVCSGETGHAEVVQICFDESKISYQELLTIFFSLHDATQLNRQGHDVGTQYRSAIFYHDKRQKKLAMQMITSLTTEAVFAEPIVTSLEPLNTFYVAEQSHQGYYLKHPQQGYCAMVITPKFEKFKKTYQKRLKKT